MRITERGQVTIPKNLRNKYGISTATELDFLEKKDGIMLVKARTISPLERFRGIAKKNRDIPNTTDEFLKAIREGQ